jgi:hypothetical protein
MACWSIAHDPCSIADLARGPDGPMARRRRSADPYVDVRGAQERYDIGRINPQSRYARSFPQQVASTASAFRR